MDRLTIYQATCQPNQARLSHLEALTMLEDWHQETGLSAMLVHARSGLMSSARNESGHFLPARHLSEICCVETTQQIQGIRESQVVKAWINSAHCSSRAIRAELYVESILIDQQRWLVIKTLRAYSVIDFGCRERSHTSRAERRAS